MEHGSLDQFLGKNPNLPIKERRRMARETAHGLAYLHNSGMVHRDVKSPNILLDRNNTVKITDFGLTALHDATLTSAGMGSAFWMAPELANLTHASPETDVFSYGVVLNEIMSGQFPYSKGLNAVAILTAVGKGERPKLAENCSPAEKLIITQCWEQDPAKRPTMNEVIQVFQILEASEYKTEVEAIKKEFTRLRDMRGVVEPVESDAFDPLERVSPLNMGPRV